MAKSGTLVVRFIGDLREFDRATKSMGAKLTQTGKTLTMGVTLPLVAVGAAAVKMEAQYSSSMKTLQVASGASAKQMDMLDKLALKMGADTTFGARDAADAMVELAKSGLTPAQIKAGALQGSMALAATEGMNLADAAGVISNSMAQFNLKAGEASRVADVLAAGSKASTASVESLAYGLRQVGPAAKTAGLNLNDTVGALSLFDANALKGQDAGTSFKQFLSSLAPSTEKATATLESLGVQLTDREGNFKSITAIAKELRQGFGDLSQSERTLAVRTVFGSDAMRAANIIIDEGAKGLKKYIDATREQGVAQEMANARMSGTAGAIERLKGSLESAGIVIGRALAPTIQSLAENIGAMVEWFSKLDPKMQQTIVAGGALAAALGPVLIVVGSLVRAIGSIATGFANFTNFMADAGKRATAMKVAIRGLAGAAGLGALTMAMQETSTKTAVFEGAIGGALTGFAVGGPWGAAIGAGVGGLGLLAKNLLGSGKSANKAELDIADYTATLNRMTGATTRATKELVAQKFQEAGVLDKLEALNISTHDAVMAALGHKDAQKRVNQQLAAAKERLAAMERNLYAAGNGTAFVNAKTAGLRDAINRAEDALRSESGQIRTAVRDNQQLQKAVVGTTQDVTRYQKVLDKTPKEVATMLLAEGIDKAIGGTEKFRERVNDIMDSIRDEQVDIKLSASAARTASKIANVAESFHAVGGRVRGPGTGMSDSVSARLSDGEFVIRERVARQIYPFLTMLNKGQAEAMEAAGAKTKKGLIRFAQGGRVVAGTNAMTPVMETSTALTGIRNYAHQYQSSLDSFGDQLGSALSKALNQMLAFGGNGQPLGPGGTLSMGQLVAGQGFAKSQAGKPYVWGGVGPGGYDCSGFQSAVLNAALGQYPYSRRGSTGTMPWSGSSPGVGRYTIGWFTGSPGHTSGNIGGLGVESRGGDGVVVGSGATSPLSSMFNGLMHYDRGGPLKPGLTLAYNGTGRTERVVRDGPRRLVFEGPVRLDVDGHEVGGVIRGVVREEMEDEARYVSGGM